MMWVLILTWEGGFVLGTVTFKTVPVIEKLEPRCAELVNNHIHRVLVLLSSNSWINTQLANAFDGGSGCWQLNWWFYTIRRILTLNFMRFKFSLCIIICHLPTHGHTHTLSTALPLQVAVMLPSVRLQVSAAGRVGCTLLVEIVIASFFLTLWAKQVRSLIFYLSFKDTTLDPSSWKWTMLI